MPRTITLEPITSTGDEAGSGVTGPRIRCPQCQWEPQPHDRWACSCGHSWNTFETGGVCPACITQWPTTQCHACERWSAHSDWYVY